MKQMNESDRLYRVRDPGSWTIGDSWMRGRLLSGDLVFRIYNGSDYYIIVQEYFNGLWPIPESKFFSYNHGDAEIATEWDITLGQLEKLKAGEFVETKRLTLTDSPNRS